MTAIKMDEQRHLEAEKNIKVFKYDKATNGKEFGGGIKKFVPLGSTKTVRSQVQVLKEGGENNLHYHTNTDIFYMVLRGRVKFYGPEDKLYGDFGQHEGLVLPADSRYWFESSSKEELVLLQIVANTGAPHEAKRIIVDAQKPRMDTDKELTVYGDK